MKTLKMPIKSKKVYHTPYELFMMLRSFIQNETTGLDDDCLLSADYSKEDLLKALDSLQFYLALVHEPTVLPLDYQVLDDEKFFEEYDDLCQK